MFVSFANRYLVLNMWLWPQDEGTWLLMPIHVIDIFRKVFLSVSNAPTSGCTEFAILALFVFFTCVIRFNKISDDHIRKWEIDLQNFIDLSACNWRSRNSVTGRSDGAGAPHTYLRQPDLATLF
jgi:hypothetical protein